jgi:hypothetical protein
MRVLVFSATESDQCGIMKTKSEVAQLELTGLAAVVEACDGGAVVAEREEAALVVVGGNNGGVNRMAGSRTTKTASPATAAEPTIRKFRKARSVAAQLGICPRTIFRWADAGKIARHKINARMVLFDVTEVAAFIESARIRVVA